MRASLLVACFLLALPATVSGAELSAAADLGRLVPGPDFELLGLDGELHKLADSRGKITLVNFWATWCVSCRSEIPELVTLRQEFAPEDFEIPGISVDKEGAEKVVPYVEEMGMTYPVLLDPKSVSPEIFGGIEGYPMTFIFDREGLIYSSYLGAQTIETFREDVRYLLGASASEAAPLVDP